MKAKGGRLPFASRSSARPGDGTTSIVCQPGEQHEHRDQAHERHIDGRPGTAYDEPARSRRFA
jgi:hypothetical protein